MPSDTWSRLKSSSEEFVVIATSVAVGFALLVLNYAYIRNVAEPLISAMITILSFVVMTVPIGIIQYGKSQEAKEMEESFPDFARSVVEGIHGGMTLPLAIKYAARSSYGALDKPIQRMMAKISWGIPFEEAMRDLADDTGSRVVKRAISTIIEAHKSGGDIASVLESVARSTVAIEKIQKERQSKISTQMTQGYVIFFIFIGIMIGLQKFLIPALGFGSAHNPALEQITKGDLFLHLAVLQGFFAGLAIGKLAEGRISAGLKHSLILAVIGFIALTLSSIS